jgi:hypothetical protein
MRLLLAALLAAAPALAATQSEPRGEATLTAEGAIEIADMPCQALLAGAPYVPGVDAEGRAVAPADLPAAPSPVTVDAVTVDIKSVLAGRFGVSDRGGVDRSRISIGTVTVRGGRAYFNGAPLAADASAALEAACRAAKK